MCLYPWVEPEEGTQWSLAQLPAISLRQVLSLNLGLMFSWLDWKSASPSNPPPAHPSPWKSIYRPVQDLTCVGAGICTPALMKNT